MVTALLGLPAPAHSTGSGRLLPVAVNMLRPLTVAEDVEGNPAKDARDHHLQLLAADLALQQRDFTSQMATELSQVQSGDWVSSITQTQMQEINSWMDAADLTLAYHAEHVELRDSDSRWTVGLNMISSLIFASLLLWVVNNNEDAPYSPRLRLPCQNLINDEACAFCVRSLAAGLSRPRPWPATVGALEIERRCRQPQQKQQDER